MKSALDVALRVAAVFEQLGIAYYLGGSLASSIHGEPRATNDIDLVVDLGVTQVASLAKALGEDFDVDEAALLEAIRERGSWNIFFLPYFFKIDLFILGSSDFDRVEFSRRRKMRVREDGAALVVDSAEDSVLRKLLWWRAGGGVSSTQWRDVVQVIRVGGTTLDAAYLDHWASEHRLEGEISRARREAAEVD